MEDRKSWTVKDESILDDLVTLMGITDAEREILGALQEQAKAMAPQLADDFYGRISAHANTAEYVEGKVDRLKGTLQQWFTELFSGNYDQAYIQRRLKIGHVHVRIGLPVRYPIAMVDLVLKVGEKVAAQSGQPELAIKAFQKVLALDIAILTQTYENSQLKHLAEMVGNERLARRMLTR